MADSLYTSTTNKLVGFPLLIAALMLLVWNENHYLHAMRLFGEAHDKLTELTDTLHADPANEGRLVHYGAWVRLTQPVYDPLYGAGGNFASVERQVEYYQWHENSHTEQYRDRDGDTQTRTVYTYDKIWSSKVLDTESYHTSEGRSYDNTPHTVIESTTTYAKSVLFGPYELAPELIDSIPVLEPGVHALTTSSTAFKAAADSTTHHGSVPLYVMGDTLYYGNLKSIDIEHNPNAGCVGDVRVIFYYRRPCHAWALAQPRGNILQPFHPSDGYWLTYARFRKQNFDPEEAIDFEVWGFNMLVWTLRLIGWLTVMGGIKQLLGMLLGFLKKIPIVGAVAEFGVAVVSWTAGTVLTVVVIGATFLILRPLLGVIILGSVALLCVAIAWSKRRRQPVPPPLPPDTL